MYGARLPIALRSKNTKPNISDSTPIIRISYAAFGVMKFPLESLLLSISVRHPPAVNALVEPERQLSRRDPAVRHMLGVHDDQVGASFEQHVGDADQVTVPFGCS